MCAPSLGVIGTCLTQGRSSASGAAGLDAVPASCTRSDALVRGMGHADAAVPANAPRAYGLRDVARTFSPMLLDIDAWWQGYRRASLAHDRGAMSVYLASIHGRCPDPRQHTSPACACRRSQFPFASSSDTSCAYTRVPRSCVRCRCSSLRDGSCPGRYCDRTR